MRRLCYIVAALTSAPLSPATGAAIFESGTLGQTGQSFQEVPGTSVQSGIFTGVRFELAKPVFATEIGGHFVSTTPGSFFGAVVSLDDENDFPDSLDLSTPDVLGTALLTFPALSDEVFGSVSLRLDPGWYALAFGSGLFGATGSGGATRNNYWRARLYWFINRPRLVPAL